MTYPKLSETYPEGTDERRSLSVVESMNLCSSPLGVEMKLCA